VLGNALTLPRSFFQAAPNEPPASALLQLERTERSRLREHMHLCFEAITNQPRPNLPHPRSFEHFADDPNGHLRAMLFAAWDAIINHRFELSDALLARTSVTPERVVALEANTSAHLAECRWQFRTTGLSRDPRTGGSYALAYAVLARHARLLVTARTSMERLFRI
jgi:hypothetical protein